MKLSMYIIHLMALLDSPVSQCKSDTEPTVREFFRESLINLVRDEEGFSGKRPVGDSGWFSDMKVAVLRVFPELGTLDWVPDVVDSEYIGAENVEEHVPGSIRTVLYDALNLMLERHDLVTEVPDCVGEGLLK